MNIFVLGPALSINEPAPAAPATPPVAGVPVRVGIIFDPATPILAGGVTNVQFQPAPAGAELPVAIHVFYVPGTLTPPAPATAEWFMALTGVSSAAYQLPTPAPASGVSFPISVSPAPAEGPYLVQTVLEYLN